MSTTPAQYRDFERHVLPVGDTLRNFLLYRPPTTDDRPLPIVLALHGTGIDARMMAHFCGIDELAAEEGFAVVYPNGTGRTTRHLTWNAGNCCGHAKRENVDDVAFFHALLDDLPGHLPVDPRRVYITGMSAGAMMAYRLAAEMSDRIAAIAPVAGPMECDHCLPTQPVSVCHFHGTADDYAPYDGGIGAKSLLRNRFHSVEHSIERWVQANECQPTPRIEHLPILVDDGTQVTRTWYTGGQAGSEVILHTIAQMGHTWPGRQSIFPNLGRSSANIDANAVMWQFFQRHTR